jgi:hypothetical protein
MSAFFTQAELDILSTYLRQPIPKGLAVLDRPPEGEDVTGDFDYDIKPETELDGRVARIALSIIQSRLPQCGVVRPDGKVDLNRKYFPRLRRGVVLLPQFLFMINWADTAPGVSWPESYYVTYIPGFDQYVVTASQDGPEMWGVADLAIGAFPPRANLVEASHGPITQWWRMQRDAWDQARWAYVWQEGMVELDQANAWGDEVWITDADDDEEE